MKVPNIINEKSNLKENPTKSMLHLFTGVIEPTPG